MTALNGFPLDGAGLAKVLPNALILGFGVEPSAGGLKGVLNALELEADEGIGG